MIEKITNGLIVIVVALFISSFNQTQEGNLSVLLNNEGITIDSLYVMANNPKIAYKEKMRQFYRCIFKRKSQQEKQITTIQILLKESKRKKDINGLLYGYVYLADLYNEWNNEVLFQTCIDSADQIAEKATHSIALAAYHYIKGTQAINEAYGKKEGYKQFEMAIDHYSRIINDIPYFGYILYNMTIYVANQPDTTFTKRLIHKVETIFEKEQCPFIDFSLSTMKSDFYIQCFHATKNENMLDSAIYFEKKRIRLFYENPGILPEKLDYDILQSHLLIAEYYSLKKEPDWEAINTCIDHAKAIEYEDDHYILSRINYTEALSLFAQNQFHKAEKKISRAEKFLAKQIQEGGTMYPPETFYSDEMAYANLHYNVLLATGRHREALEYNQKMIDLKQKMREIDIRELEYLYNTEKEERKIEQLLISNANRIQSTTILIVTAILLMVVIALISLWFYAVVKNSKRRSALIRAEKEEAELNLKIKEEQAIKAQLEKYEILSDFRMKEMELEGKTKMMEQLIKDKDYLDKKIELYTQKINDYELDSERQQGQNKEESSVNLKYIDDITKLINKKLSKKKEYILLLSRINRSYINTLRNAYAGNLSIPYLKYCICFAIGMEISEVSECFSIEQSSVHMVRYRLKKKFGLNNNDDLDIFLRRLKP